VTDHSSWRKSSYFLPYSLTQQLSGLTQLSWLNIYYTGICLLLCWQYFRLARAVGLGARASMIFVVLQALLMGNNVFSFYRYYGLSSSILAQIAAIALIRIAIDFASRGATTKLGSGIKDSHQFARKPGGNATGSRPPKDPTLNPTECLPLRYTCFSIPQLTGAALLLIWLALFNHIQGLGIAGLGVMSIFIWRLTNWKRTMISWLALAAIALSVAAVAWFPRHPAIEEVYRPFNWLTSWYGFNILEPAAPAFDRTLHIFGLLGLINIVASLWLLRRNHLAGWLTLTPIGCLALPFIALPFAHVVASTTSIENIVTFHRLLLGAPTGLALVALIACRSKQSSRNSNSLHSASQPEDARHTPKPRERPRTRPNAPGSKTDPKGNSLLIVSLLLLQIVPPGQTTFNRLWHSLQITPDDLNLSHLVAASTSSILPRYPKESSQVLATPLGFNIQEIFAPSLDWSRRRYFHGPVQSTQLEQHIHWLEALPMELYDDKPSSASSDPVLGDRLDLSHKEIWREDLILIANPTAAETPWLLLGGYPPRFTYRDGELSIKSPAGLSSYIFNPELIPISRSHRYTASMAVKQSGSKDATNYLAVAWYDSEKRWLSTHQPQPVGAGNPPGWHGSGTYSYFGLINQPAPTRWHRYNISFGFGEKAAIPANATYLRIGALLNFNSSSDAVIEIARTELRRMPDYEHLTVIAPSPVRLRSPASQAAFLSKHWPPQHVPLAHVGGHEFRQTLGRNTARQ
jgi:hypothetical protein